MTRIGFRGPVRDSFQPAIDRALAELETSPQVVAGVRTPRGPLPPETFHRDLRWEGSELPRALHRLADPEVPRGQHVRSPEGEDQVHLRGPPPNPVNPRHVLDDLLIGHFGDPREI